MPRVKGGYTARHRRKKVLKLAKGYFGSKHLLYRTANEQVMRSLRYAYRDRRQLKREMRKIWITRINAAARMNGLSYSKLTHGLSLAGIEINRKMLSEMAVHDANGFAAIAAKAKEALASGKKVEAAPVVETSVNLEKLTVAELRDLAKERGITGVSAMKKADLITALQ